MRRLASVACVVMALGVSAALGDAPFYQVFEVTPLTTPGFVWGINGPGDVVGWSANQGWVYSDVDGLRPLSDLVAVPLPTSRAFAINDANQICGDFSSEGAQLGFLIDEPDLLELVPASGLELAFANDLSNAGVVAGTSSPDPGKGSCCSRATAWWAGTPQDLGVLGGFDDSAGNAVNEAGQIVGSSFTCNPPIEPICDARPTLWQSGAIQDLGLLAGFDNSWGVDINDAGAVAGYAQFGLSAQHGFLRMADGTFVDLGQLPGLPFMDPWALNNSGAIVGSIQAEESVPNTETVAFLWLDGEIHDLNDRIPAASGFQLLRAVDVNDAGQIAVLAIGAGGTQRYALRLDPDDEPVPAYSAATLIAWLLLQLGAGVWVLRSRA